MDLATFTPERLAALRRRYSIVPPALSVGTVRDFCDSLDHLAELAALQNDMKDLQRPWMFKTILSVAPPGARLLEIGAGEPHVAQLLAACGCEVWAVDPYDGSGRGPTEFEAFRSRYPQLKIIRAQFGTHLTDIPADAFDCVYSISVLEHIPHPNLADVIAASRRCLRPGGFHVHAVDHVYKGNGSTYHLQTLELIRRELRLEAAALQRVLAMVENDPDVYFLSAEAHNRWRGATSYDEFPMRRCLSVQYCVPRGA
jgi:SAM-dependent methyltransferase